MFWNSLQNSGHAIVFAGISVVAMYLLHRLHKKHSLLHIICVGLGLSTLGILIEFTQQITGRGASPSDLLMNTAGIVCGCCLYTFSISVFQQKQTIKSCSLFIVGTAAMAWSLQWPLVYAVAEVHRPAIPLLADFEDKGAQYFVTGNESVKNIKQHMEWSQNSSRSLKAQFQPGRYPNVQFLEPETDWSKFSHMTFKTYNPTGQPITISVRIDDRSLGVFDDDHMTVKQLIPVGSFEVALNFDLFKADALQRARPGHATFKHIHSFMIFVANNEKITTLFFDDFLLQ